MLTINNEPSSPERARNTVRQFIDAAGFAVPVLMDNGSVARAYDVNVIPTYVVVDRKGVVRMMHTGGLSSEQLERAIASASDGP